MRPKLSQKQSQKTILLPQIRMNVEMLQLPIIELHQALNAAMEQNPALEEDVTDGADESPSEAEESEDTFEEWEKYDEPSYNDNSYDSIADVQEAARKKNYQESLIVKETTLLDHIHSQIHILDLSDEERLWTEELIGSLDENGFLKEKLGDLAVRLSVPENTLETLIKKLQELDPPGIFAKDLAECLSIQLNRSDYEDSKIASDIVQYNFPLLQKKSFSQLSRIYKISDDHIRSIFEHIQRLDPKPGKAFISSRSLEIVPDIIISAPKESQKKYQTEIQELGLPKLKITSDYKKMTTDKSLDLKAKKFVRENVEQALWLIEALNYRKETLSSIVKEILIRQPEFLEKGFSALKPLRMREIAEKLNIHESTVSRAVSGKYIQTPIGTFPIRSFFSGKVETSHSDSEESQKSVMAQIKKLIDDEDLKHPLSDQKIAEILAKENINIARRTVAKYREILKILPTNLRRSR